MAASLAYVSIAVGLVLILLLLFFFSAYVFLRKLSGLRPQGFAIDIELGQLPPNQRPPLIITVEVPQPPQKVNDEARIREIAKGCQVCAICLEEYGSDEKGVERRILKPCGHRFHKVCIDEWLEVALQQRCPMCRGCMWETCVEVQGQEG